MITHLGAILWWSICFVTIPVTALNIPNLPGRPTKKGPQLIEHWHEDSFPRNVICKFNAVKPTVTFHTTRRQFIDASKKNDLNAVSSKCDEANRRCDVELVMHQHGVPGPTAAILLRYQYTYGEIIVSNGSSKITTREIAFDSVKGIGAAIVRDFKKYIVEQVACHE